MDKVKRIENGIEKGYKVIDRLYPIVVKERLRAGEVLFNRCREAGIKYVVHKGAILSYVLYGNPFVRKSGDTDILISRADANRVKGILFDNGFVQGYIVENPNTHICEIKKYSRTEMVFQASQSHQLAAFVKKVGNAICGYVNYDVNMDILWGESGRHVDMDSFLDDTMEIDICGIRLCKLKPEAEFIAMCMHHYKDLNSIYLLWKCGINKTELEEIYLYVKKNIMDLEYLYNISLKYEVSDYIYYCISKAYEIYRDSVLKKLSQKFESETGKILLDCFGLCDLERKCWNVAFTPIWEAEDIKVYMEPLLTAEDFRKIQLNDRMM